jgi:hypothetical protein
MWFSYWKRLLLKVICEYLGICTTQFENTCCNTIFTYKTWNGAYKLITLDRRVKTQLHRKRSNGKWSSNRPIHFPSSQHIPIRIDQFSHNNHTAQQNFTFGGEMSSWVMLSKKRQEVALRTSPSLFSIFTWLHMRKDMQLTPRCRITTSVKRELTFIN